MPPAEVTLQATDIAGRYRGELAFTMAGPWRLWLRAEGIHGTMIGTIVRTTSAAVARRETE